MEQTSWSRSEHGVKCNLETRSFSDVTKKIHLGKQHNSGNKASRIMVPVFS